MRVVAAGLWRGVILLLNRIRLLDHELKLVERCLAMPDACCFEPLISHWSTAQRTLVVLCQTKKSSLSCSSHEAKLAPSRMLGSRCTSAICPDGAIIVHNISGGPHRIYLIVANLEQDVWPISPLDIDVLVLWEERSIVRGFIPMDNTVVPVSRSALIVCRRTAGSRRSSGDYPLSKELKVLLLTPFAASEMRELEQ